MPCPENPGLVLGDWMSGLLDYLHQAQPPSDLALVPAVSIRAFFASLQTLIRHVTALPAGRQQRHLFDDDSEPRGAVLPRMTPTGRSHVARRRASVDDPVADRRRPAQQALVFDDDAQDDGPASVPIVTVTELAPLEQPQSHRGDRSTSAAAASRCVGSSAAGCRPARRTRHAAAGDKRGSTRTAVGVASTAAPATAVGAIDQRPHRPRLRGRGVRCGRSRTDGARAHRYRRIRAAGRHLLRGIGR